MPRSRPKYTITQYTRRRAKALGVSVKLSSNPHKKLDVFRKTKKIASVGAVGYADYPTFMKICGRACARQKRRSYKRRHEKDRHRRGTNGYYADKLLW